MEKTPRIAGAPTTKTVTDTVVKAAIVFTILLGLLGLLGYVLTGPAVGAIHP
jgi:hypothetical protein